MTIGNDILKVNLRRQFVGEIFGVEQAPNLAGIVCLSPAATAR
jgi:hypothetical protein